MSEDDTTQDEALRQMARPFAGIRVYDKLVRDKVPDMISNQDKAVAYHTVKGATLMARFRDKLLEEFDELVDDPCHEEAADLYEVVRSIVEHLDLDMGRVVYDIAAKKREQRGSYSRGVVLEVVYE